MLERRWEDGPLKVPLKVPGFQLAGPWERAPARPCVRLGGPGCAGGVEPKVEAPGGARQDSELPGGSPTNLPSHQDVGNRWAEAFCRGADGERAILVLDEGDFTRWTMINSSVSRAGFTGLW